MGDTAFKVGNKITIDKEKFIISHTGKNRNEIILVSTVTGNLWNKPVKVKEYPLIPFTKMMGILETGLMQRTGTKWHKSK